MIVPSHPPTVPLFHSLESGTVEHEPNQRNERWNTSGTASLKALAHKVLERNKEWNKPGTEALKPVPPLPQSASACGTSIQAVEQSAFCYELEERAAIMEYDGGLPREEAERMARVDIEENSGTNHGTEPFLPYEAPP